LNNAIVVCCEKGEMAALSLEVRNPGHQPVDRRSEISSQKVQD
jgi:hypothetical protein